MCQQCKKNPVYEFTNKRKLCRNCFVKWFQKKFLYIIRKFRMIQKNDVIYFENKKDFRGVVLGYILKMFAEKFMIELVELRSQACDIDRQLIQKSCLITSNQFRAKRDKLKINKIAIASTVDLEADEIIHDLIRGEVKKLKKVAPTEGKIIKPLYLFLDKEILIYAKLKKLKFEKDKIKKDKISKFIDELEKKHPEIKRAIVKGYLELDD